MDVSRTGPKVNCFFMHMRAIINLYDCSCCYQVALVERPKRIEQVLTSAIYTSASACMNGVELDVTKIFH